jgi:hypothetical protein
MLHRPIPSLTVLLVSTLMVSTVCAAPAARVEFVMGDPAAVNAAGRERVLRKGDSVDSGDMVNTRTGRAQLRFSDGAYVSLQPDTQFRIDDYRYDGKSDGTERGFFSLLKGGMRTITGLVGRMHKRNYQVSTTVATIGIRGTEYTLSMSGGLRGSVGEGEIQVCNTGGCLPVTSGQSFVVAQPDTRPTIAAKKSDLPPAPPSTETKQQFVAGDNVSSTGGPLGVTAIKDGPGYTMVYAKNGGGGPAGSISPGTATFDPTHGLLSYALTSGNFNRGSSTAAKNDFDLFISYGTWSNQYLQNGNSFTLLSNQGFHYVVGLPTPQTGFGGTATYTMLGGSNPTGDNNLTGQLLSATLSADLSIGKVKTTVNFQYGPFNYVLTGNNLVLNKSSATFSGSVTTTGCGSPTGCGGSITGLFAGPNAENAGLAYNVSDFSGSTFNVGGVVAFKK